MKITAELIERYLDGELSQNELNNFEAQLKIDEELQAVIELHKEVDMAISQSDVIELREQLGAIAEKHKEQENATPKRSIRRFAWLAAASVAALLVVTVFLNQQPQNNSQLFQDNYTAWSGPDNVRAASDMQDAAISEAIELYKDENYQEALSKFNLILNDSPDNNMIRLYASISQIESGKLDEAENNLNVIIDSKDIFYTEHAQWYLALASISKGNMKNAKAILQNIISENTSYSEDASELLKAL
jgi:tetratricopeptide (TPR) repeat protein